MLNQIAIIAAPFILAFCVIFPLVTASKPHFEDTEEFLNAMEPDENSYS